MNTIVKSHLLGICLSCLMIAVQAQEATLLPPFDFPITFSGNFGELRTNHFHGGLDFKTGGEIGKSVHALADGYISRIRVTHGSGYILDVAYNNGYTTINRHLSAFVGGIAKRVEDLQYKNESWEVDIIPQPNEYPVKAGQVIALSGNTGYSFGPHLHLDLIESATNDFVDPLPFFADKVKDHIAPRAIGLMLFPQQGKGVVNGSQRYQAFSIRPNKVIAAWGWIGVGIRAYDYMDCVSNRYGVHTVILEVDGKEIFRSVVDRFSADENRYINSWTQGAYMKSFIAPGNKLRMLHVADHHRGLIYINEERPYHFVYTLSDALGNTSKVRFTVQGRRSTIAPVEHRDKYYFRWNRTNILQEPGLSVVVPQGTLYEDVDLDYHIKADSGSIAFTYQLHHTPVPLHHPATISLGVRRFPIADSTKYYVVSIGANGVFHSLGGVMKNGFMKTKVRELSTFTVAIDTFPPTLTPIGAKQWGRNRRIVFQAKDRGTGIQAYRGTIDGHYALFGKPNAVSGLLVCELDARRIKKGTSHHLTMSVTDGCGNVTTRHYTFYY